MLGREMPKYRTASHQDIYSIEDAQHASPELFRHLLLCTLGPKAYQFSLLVNQDIVSVGYFSGTELYKADRL